MDEKNTNSQVYKLCSSLVDAKKRGVRVKVILDQNIDYMRERKEDEWQVEDKNQNAFSFFKKNGIEVFYDTKNIYTHSKAIVIDENIVISGSTNWSNSALNKNNEASVLIRSSELAKSFLKDFSDIAIDNDAGRDVNEKEPKLAIYRYFLENEDLAGRMITNSDERAFDVYLLLLREYKDNAFIDFDYDSVAGSLDMDKEMNKEEYRRQLIKTLKKIEEIYGLIKFEPEFGKNAKVTLLDQKDKEKPYAYPEGNFFLIPGEYFSYKWDTTLSFKAKFCYLINLYKASQNLDNPKWADAREILSKQFHLNIDTISQGMIELRRLNIIDVEYSSIEDGYESREPSKYKVLDLYDPLKQAEEWERLKRLYGADRFAKAKGFAEVVFEENDPAVVEDIIFLIDEYGIEKYQAAINIVAQKAADNPKRTQSYVVGILRSKI
ncbi:MAG: phospholipase D-like domain-containing protein [bacterium]|nr:phospholipase D-like domain-containing protein [bacterium]